MRNCWTLWAKGQTDKKARGVQRAGRKKWGLKGVVGVTSWRAFSGRLGTLDLKDLGQVVVIHFWETESFKFCIIHLRQIFFYSSNLLYRLHSSAQAATTQCHRPGALNNKHSFLAVREPGSPGSRCQVICTWRGLPPRLAELHTRCACRWPFLGVCAWREDSWCLSLH